MTLLAIKDLRVNIGEKEILQGLSLNVAEGEIHTIMGPNGSGKSSLAMALMGHPLYRVESGQVLLGEEDLLQMEVDERSQKGLFLSFQHPREVGGVTLAQFLLHAHNAQRKKLDSTARPVSVFRFKRALEKECEALKMDPLFLDRFLNQGFSGGEKKKSEILQMAVLKPKIAILDEIDSGLDIDALRVVSESVNKVKAENPRMAIVIITHYHRLLKHIRTDKVHVLYRGRIIRSGEENFAHELEARGYEWLIQNN